MKYSFCFIFAFYFAFSSLKGQDTTQSQYAVVHIKSIYRRVFINYSNGQSQKLKIEIGNDVKDENSFYQRDQVIFKAFKLLNEQGFELVNAISIRSKREYYFKRIRR